MPPWAVRFGELDRPALLFAGIDFEEAAAVEAAGEAILRAADRELPLAGAHEGAAAPFAAPVVIDRVDVVEPGAELPLQQGLAAARIQVPPALRHPALRIAIAERDADAARRHVAQAQVRVRRRRAIRKTRAMAMKAASARLRRQRETDEKMRPIMDVDSVNLSGKKSHNASDNYVESLSARSESASSQTAAFSAFSLLKISSSAPLGF